jgi:hypothetical protein
VRVNKWVISLRIFSFFFFFFACLLDMMALPSVFLSDNDVQRFTLWLSFFLFFITTLLPEVTTIFVYGFAIFLYAFFYGDFFAFFGFFFSKRVSFTERDVGCVAYF